MPASCAGKWQRSTFAVQGCCSVVLCTEEGGGEVRLEAEEGKFSGFLLVPEVHRHFQLNFVAPEVKWAYRGHIVVLKLYAA